MFRAKSEHVSYIGQAFVKCDNIRGRHILFYSFDIIAIATTFINTFVSLYQKIALSMTFSTVAR